MADNITVKDANGNDVVMRSTQQTLDEVTVVQVAHHIPEGEILETLQNISLTLQAILAQLPIPDFQNNGYAEVKTRLSSSSVTLPVSVSFGSLTTVSTVTNLGTIASLDPTFMVSSTSNSDYQFQRDRIVIT